MTKWNIERQLSWVNELSAGIGLILGYLLFGAYWLLTPDVTVEINRQNAEYIDTVMGMVPDDRFSFDWEEIEVLDRVKPFVLSTPKMIDNLPVVTTKKHQG